MKLCSRLAVAAFAFVFILAIGAHTAAAQTFKHPGVLMDREQLDYMKTMVAGHAEPFYSTFLKAKQSTWGNPNYAPLGPRYEYIQCGSSSNPNYGCSDANNDSTAAYVQALLWYITGDHAYATKAIELLNLYGSKLKGYDTNYSNAPLQAAWDGQKWARAAEIIRYSNAGWSDVDIQQFQNMLTNAILPRVANGAKENGNWETSMIETLLGIGVFNDDRATFDKGIQYWRERIPAYFYYHIDGSQPVKAPRGTPSWYGQTVYDATVDGVQQETCRDFGHAQYGVTGTLNAAETAHIQGVDLYSEQQDRLVAAMEFNAYYLLGHYFLKDQANLIPTAVCGGTVTWGLEPIYEVGYNAYHNRLRVSLPYTVSYLQNVIRKHSSPVDTHMVAFESLTHGGDPSSLPPFLFWTGPDIAAVNAGNSASYTVTLVPGKQSDAAVTFSLAGLPAGATYSFDRQTLTGSGTTTLTINTSRTVQPGIYPLTVTGNSGSVIYTNVVSLTLNASAADFSISVSPDLVTAIAGESSTYTIQLTPQTGYLAQPTLSITRLPDGATASFSPSKLSPDSPISTLTLNTSGSTAPGAYVLAISATDGAASHSATTTLLVNTLNSGCIPQLGNTYLSGELPTQTGQFTAEWDATPSTAANNANVGLSSGAASAFANYAVAARFYTNGLIDARKGAGFAADRTIPYQAGVTYHFRAVVNVPARTYSMYVSSPGQPEVSVGTNFEFRSEAGPITSIDHWDAISQVGTIALCNVNVTTNDYSISASPETQSISPGAASTFTVTMQSGEGHTAPANLSISGLPGGATATFSTQTLSGDGGASTLTVTTPASLAPGVYPLTITANDGTSSRYSYVALKVNASCQPPTATPQSIAAPANGYAAINLSGTVGAYCSSTDTLTYTITSQPTHGRLDGTAESYVYTPAPGYVGTDTFTYTATDSNATPATGARATVSITVAVPTSGAPIVSGLSPSFAAAGSDAITLQVNGNGFAQGATVRWNNQSLTTKYVSSTQLSATVPAANLASPGTADITVVGPGADGAISSSVKFAVDTPASILGRPTISVSTATITVMHGRDVAIPLTLGNIAAEMQVKVSCYNLPAGASCTYNSSSKTVTITTGGGTPAGTYQVLLVCVASRTQTAMADRLNGRLGILYGFFMAPLGLFLVGSQRKKCARFGLCCLVLFLLLIGLIGCGGGNSNGASSPVQNNSTGGQASTIVTLTVS